MHPFMNEDEAWRRLQDIQREMENRRFSPPARARLAGGAHLPTRWGGKAAGQPNATFETIKQLAARVWLLAGLAAMRPPRRRPTTIREDGDRRARFV